MNPIPLIQLVLLAFAVGYASTKPITSGLLIAVTFAMRRVEWRGR